MEARHLKDFVIALVVVFALILGIKLYSLNQKIEKVPEESQYKKIALSEALMVQIQEIEESIQDRKDFFFTVEKDPLEQNLVVRTKRDLERQWREEVANMVRLESTIITQEGDRLATIAYQGKSRVYRVGDSFVKGKIETIQLGEIVYSYEGLMKTLSVERIPPKPTEVSKQSSTRSALELNW